MTTFEYTYQSSAVIEILGEPEAQNKRNTLQVFALLIKPQVWGQIEQNLCSLQRKILEVMNLTAVLLETRLPVDGDFTVTESEVIIMEETLQLKNKAHTQPSASASIA